MKKQILILVFLILTNFAYSQDVSIKSLVEKTNELNLDMWDLTTFAEKNIKNKEQLAKFYYYWIGSNIKYDRELLNKKETISNKEFWKTQKENIVYNSRKGVCAGYAKLYSWFLEWADIETIVISGHIRNQKNHYVKLDADDNFRHAWNAIKINGKWILVDTTWGTSNNSEISDFYFDIKPEFAIITHFPEDKKWQLLEKPLSLNEFNQSKFINSIWFFKGFSNIPKLKTDKEYFYFEYKINTDNWKVDLLYSSDNLKFKTVDDVTKIDQDGNTYLKFPKNQMPEHIFFKVNIYNSINAYDDVINFKK